MRKGDTKKERFIEGKKFASENARNLWMQKPNYIFSNLIPKRRIQGRNQWSGRQSNFQIF